MFPFTTVSYNDFYVKRVIVLLSFFFVSHMCPLVSNAAEAFMLCEFVTDLVHFCMFDFVCVCVSNRASRHHLGYSYIYHLPHSFFPFLMPYIYVSTSTVYVHMFHIYFPPPMYHFFLEQIIILTADFFLLIPISYF